MINHIVKCVTLKHVVLKYITLCLMLLFINVSNGTTNDTKILLFFYASYCHYCEGTADNLVALQDKYNFKIIACSLDNKPIKQFAVSELSEQLIDKFNIYSVPTVIGINFNTNKFEVLATGAVGYDILDNKINAWMIA